MKLNSKLLLLLSVVITLNSCTSSKKIVYLQNDSLNKELANTMSYEVKLQPDDLLQIIISSSDPALAIPYNMGEIRMSAPNISLNTNQTQFPYLIDQAGFIHMPVLGKIQLGGLTKTQAVEKIYALLEGNLVNPTVNLRLINYKISVLGEVNKPGTFTLTSDRVTLLEALSMSGDLTIYGKRDSILLIREQNGIKTFHRINILDANIINSELYYLKQNDVIYVEPNTTKANSSTIGPNITVAISAISLLITIVALTTR